jgi:hypothetical protein
METGHKSLHLTKRVVNQWTTLPLPLPSKETWINATKQDKDLQLMKAAPQQKQMPARAQLFTNKKHHNELTKSKTDLTMCSQNQRLILEEGTVYQVEELRAMMVAAHHATPLAGHAGVCKTHWHIAAQFWWPKMSRDIQKAVLECADCRAANMASHQGQQILGALSMDEPFDVINMDVWCPGTTLTTTMTTRNQKAILTSLCHLTGFASLAFVLLMTLDAMAGFAFSHFFAPNGLPKLVILDDGSEFKGFLIAMCDQLGMSHCVAPPEVHNSVLCESFHQLFEQPSTDWSGRQAIIREMGYERTIFCMCMEWIASGQHTHHDVIV